MERRGSRPADTFPAHPPSEGQREGWGETTGKGGKMAGRVGHCCPASSMIGGAVPKLVATLSQCDHLISLAAPAFLVMQETILRRQTNGEAPSVSPATMAWKEPPQWFDSPVWLLALLGRQAHPARSHDLSSGEAINLISH